MGCTRLIYRRKNFIFLCLLATTFWIFYSFLSLPSDKEKVRQKATKVKEKLLDDKSLLRKIDIAADAIRKVTEKIQKGNAQGPQTTPLKSLTKTPSPVEKIGKTHAPGEKSMKTHSPAGNVKDAVQAGVLSKKTSNSIPKEEKKKEGNFDKVFEIGEKLKNKTLNLGAKVKNKTMEKLSQLGVLKMTTYAKTIFVAAVWHLNLTLTDISGVMQDTNHLSKQEQLDINYPKLYSVKSNLTQGNSTIALRNVIMSNRVGFCDCEDYQCMCCSRITHKRITVNVTGCSNITFMSKSQELDFKFAMDKKLVYKTLIPVEHTPIICLGSRSKVADICIRFLNMTSKVNVLEDHKFHVVGCVEFSISLFNKTVSAFPVDCFQMPSHQHHHKEQKKLVQDIGNWMP